MTITRKVTEQYDIPTPIQIQKFLKGISYPVAKRELFNRAMENGADKVVLTALEQIDDRHSDSPRAVVRELAKLG
jgi:hypothetical protein